MAARYTYAESIWKSGSGVQVARWDVPLDHENRNQDSDDLYHAVHYRCLCVDDEYEPKRCRIPVQRIELGTASHQLVLDRTFALGMPQKSQRQAWPDSRGIKSASECRAGELVTGALCGNHESFRKRQSSDQADSLIRALAHHPRWRAGRLSPPGSSSAVLSVGRLTCRASTWCLSVITTRPALAHPNEAGVRHRPSPCRDRRGEDAAELLSALLCAAASRWRRGAGGSPAATLLDTRTERISRKCRIEKLILTHWKSRIAHLPLNRALATH